MECNTLSEKGQALSEKKQARKEISALIIPIILENMFQVLAEVISIALVGHLSALDIDTQGIVMRIVGIFSALFRGMAVGGTVLIARFYGAGKLNKTYNVFHQSIIFTVPLAILSAMILSAFPTAFLKLITNDSTLLAKGAAYMRIISCGLPFITIMAIVSSAFQGHSNTRVPMYVAIALNTVNLALGYILIYGKLGIKPMGVNGAGIALVISQTIGAIFGFSLLFSKKFHIFSRRLLKEKFFRYDFKTICDIYSFGLPCAIENTFWQFSAIIMSRALLSYGDIHLAAYQLGLQAESVTNIPAMGFSVAATTLTAKAIGMGNQKLFDTYLKQIVKLCVIVSSCSAAALFLGPKLFMTLMTDKPYIRAIGITYVFMMGFAQIPQNLADVYKGTLRSMGNKATPMIIQAIGVWAVRIPAVLLSAYVFKLPIIFVWLAIVLDQFVKFTLSFLIYRYKRKKTGMFISLDKQIEI